MSELATDYMEGVLTLRIWVAARIHLLLCGACRRYFDQLRRTVALLGNGEPSPTGSDVEERVLRAVANRPSDPPGH